jgi:hypothetical protein
MIELASGSKRSCPFKAIQADNIRFIEKKYVPPRVIIKEAKNMQREDVIKFMEHARERQETYGYRDAFRFAIYIKKQKEFPSLYKGDRPPTRSKQSTNSRSKKKKRIVRRNESQHLDVNDDENENTDVQNDDEDSRIDQSLMEVDQGTHTDRRQKEKENHGTPAGYLHSSMAYPKGKEKAVDPDEVSQDIRSHHINCPSDAFISDPAAGTESTAGAADTSSHEASSSKTRLPSPNRSDHMITPDCPSEALIPEPAAGTKPSTLGTADASGNEASNSKKTLPSRKTKFKKPFVLLITHGSPKKKSQLGRSDALAIEEAKKLLRTPRKRRR